MEPSEHNDLLSSLLRRLPGFRGYMQREDRQQSDAQTRRFVAERLEKLKVSLDKHARKLADEGRLDELAPIDGLRRRAESIRVSIERGVLSGGEIFGAESLDEDQLENLYDLEADLMDRAVEVDELSQHLAPPAASQSDGWQAIDEKLLEISRLVDRRTELLKQLLD